MIILTIHKHQFFSTPISIPQSTKVCAKCVVYYACHVDFCTQLSLHCKYHICTTSQKRISSVSISSLQKTHDTNSEADWLTTLNWCNSIFSDTSSNSYVEILNVCYKQFFVTFGTNVLARAKLGYIYSKSKFRNQIKFVYNSSTHYRRIFLV